MQTAADIRSGAKPGLGATGSRPSDVTLQGVDGGMEAPDGLVGRSPSFIRVTSKIPLLADTDATVLITGETGTGKELIAQSIHRMSRRRQKAFIPVNCGALPEELIENELFGHAKGAYTGAGSTGRGLLAEAEGGTLFLDELNSLSASAQAKLLRFLQNREYRMLGSTKLIRADVRILAATNADLRKQVELSLFREDLYHRLYVLAINIPPLRERVEDIAVLAEYFLRRYALEHGRGAVTLSDASIEKLRGYAWTGNVRELQSVMQRSLLLSRAAELGAEDIDLPTDSESVIGGRMQPREEEPPLDMGMCFREAKERAVRKFERAYLSEVLLLTDGNVTRAARMAGMQRRDLQRLLRKYNLGRGATSSSDTDID